MYMYVQLLDDTLQLVRSIRRFNSTAKLHHPTISRDAPVANATATVSYSKERGCRHCHDANVDLNQIEFNPRVGARFSSHR